MLSQEESHVLWSVGTDVLRNFVAVIVETWAVVIYTVLVVKAGLIFRNRRKRDKKGVFGSTLMFLVVIMWCLNTALWIIDVRNVIAELRITLIEASGDSLDVRYGNAIAAQLPLWIAEDAVFLYMALIGDAIVLWRVRAFWRERRERLVLLLPYAVYLGSVILTIILTYCGALSGSDISHGTFTHPPFCSKVQWSAYWEQCITAFVSSVLIAIKTWQYRRLVKNFIGDTVNRSPIYGAMMIILDTGLIYACFFMVPVITGFSGIERRAHASFVGSFALTIYQYCTSTIVGIYPTIVVILVHTHCSMIDSKGDTVVTAPMFRSASSDVDDKVDTLQMRDSNPKGGELQFRGGPYDTIGSFTVDRADDKESA